MGEPISSIEIAKMCALARSLRSAKLGEPFVLEACWNRMVQWAIRKKENGSAASVQDPSGWSARVQALRSRSRRAGPCDLMGCEGLGAF